MPKMNGARFLARTFEGYGVTSVFFVPTILSKTLMEFEERDQVKRILTHGEKAAVYMADGYARATGRPGVCIAQTVGAANLAAGLRDPFLACTPMIAITGGATNMSQHRPFYQQIEDFPLFKSVTKFSARVDEIQRLPELIRQAFRASTSGTPGPAHLEFAGHAGDLENQEADLEVIIEEAFGQQPPFRPEPEPSQVAAALKALAAAKKPIIVVGGGVRASGAGPELVEFAEKMSIPFVTSMNGKDTVPGDHPLLAGVVGLYSRKSANLAVRAADLVFFIGSQTGSQVTNNWTLPPSGTPVIHLDVNPEMLGRSYPLIAGIYADAKAGLRKLIDAADGGAAAGRKGWVKEVQGLVAAWHAEHEENMTADKTPIRPERICKELTDHLPSDAILVCDTGHAGMWTCGMIDLKHPGQGYLRAAGSLGWGLPGALGAKVGAPDRPVLLFTGDGGLWYHLSEIETAVRCNIPAVILVNDNRSLNQEIHPFTRAGGGKLVGRHHELWHFNDVNLAEVAKTMGAMGIRVEKPSELPGALDQAFSANRPVLIDCVSDMQALAPTAASY
ncbi:MAG: thiamine pyrophosphate-binding protein [bacterium]|nr:thiamine pyrophosphate-binding protein [bacterium]